MTLSRKDIIGALTLAALALLSWLPRLNGPIDLRWDGGAYYVLGTSLAQGKGYRLLNEPGEIQSTLHPPLLPVTVALHQLVLRTSDPAVVGRWLRYFYLLLFVAYAVVVYFMLRNFLPPGYAVLAALVCLFQLHTVFVSDLCFPEIPFGLATVLFTLCNLKDARRTNRLLRVPLAIISFSLRTVGVALLAAWVIESVCRRRFKQAAVRTLLALVMVLCWGGYIVYVESGAEYRNPAYEYQRAGYNYINVSYARNVQYKDPFSPELGYATLKDKTVRFIGNLALMPTAVGEAVSTRGAIWDLVRSEFNRRTGVALLPSRSVPLALFLLSGFIFAGLGLLWARQQYFIPLYTLLSLMVVCATPWPGQFNRYLAPLAPFFSLSLFLAVRAAVGRFSKWFPLRERIIRYVVTGAVVLLLVVAHAATLFLLYGRWHRKVAFEAGGGERIEYRIFFYRDLHRATDAGLDWLKGRAAGGDVVAATDPQWSYLRTGIKSVLPPFEVDAGKAQRLLDSVPVKYLVVDEGLYKKYTTRVVAAYPDRWRRIYADSIRDEDGNQEEGKFEIYERIGAQSRRGDAAEGRMGCRFPRKCLPTKAHEVSRSGKRR